MEKIERKIVTPILSQEFLTKLVDAALVPPNCSRIIVDIPANGVVAMHYAIYPDRGDEEVIFELIHEVMNRPEKKETE